MPVRIEKDKGSILNDGVSGSCVSARLARQGRSAHARRLFVLVSCGGVNRVRLSNTYGAALLCSHDVAVNAFGAECNGAAASSGRCWPSC